MIRQLDHVIYVVLDLAAASDEWRKRGFTVTPGGEHAGGLTHNALIGLEDGSYVELIAFHDVAAAKGKHGWQPVAERGGGWADFALLSNDLLKDAHGLGELLLRPPEDGGRTRPDGLAIAWRSARLRSPLPFLIEDLTARELRVPHGEAAKHANGTRGIASVDLGARDTGATAEGYARLRALGAPGIGIEPAAHDRLLNVTFSPRT
jgi:hypothetical protein